MRKTIRQSATVWIFGLLLAMFGMLSGCINATDYTDCFSVQSISPGTDLAETLIEVKYKVRNTTKIDGLTFCVTVDDSSEECTLDHGNETSVTLLVDIGCPEDFNVSCMATYEVKKEEKSMYLQEDTITYDCSEMFVHPATITYGDSTVDIELHDYQSNFFDLSELFEDFDSAVAHNVNFDDGKKYSDAYVSKAENIAYIVSDDTDERGRASAANGSILKLCTLGTQEINDTYRFADNLEVQIDDAVRAADINWDEYMSFTDEAQTNSSTVAGMYVTTIKTNVLVENPSDETVYGTVTGFFVNDSAISDDYLVGSSRTMLESGETGSVYCITSESVWKTTDESHIKKFGMKIKLEDDAGTVLYDGIQWLYLE